VSPKIFEYQAIAASRSGTALETWWIVTVARTGVSVSFDPTGAAIALDDISAAVIANAAKVLI
jgi:hypothetical protein